MIFSDLKKTMAVLLENILQRLDKVEHKLNITANISSILAKPGEAEKQHSLLAEGMTTLNLYYSW
jgi:hypothetical protein